MLALPQLTRRLPRCRRIPSSTTWSPSAVCRLCPDLSQALCWHFMLLVCCVSIRRSLDPCLIICPDFGSSFPASPPALTNSHTPTACTRVCNKHRIADTSLYRLTNKLPRLTRYPSLCRHKLVQLVLATDGLGIDQMPSSCPRSIVSCTISIVTCISFFTNTGLCLS